MKHEHEMMKNKEELANSLMRQNEENMEQTEIEKNETEMTIKQLKDEIHNQELELENKTKMIC